MWCFVWFLYITDEPNDQRWIKNEEKTYILEQRGEQRPNSCNQKPPPYLAILMNPTVWAIMLCDFANGWGIFMIVIEGPNFIDRVLHQDIATVSYIKCNIRANINTLSIK